MVWRGDARDMSTEKKGKTMATKESCEYPTCTALDVFWGHECIFDTPTPTRVLDLKSEQRERDIAISPFLHEC